MLTIGLSNTEAGRRLGHSTVLLVLRSERTTYPMLGQFVDEMVVGDFPEQQEPEAGLEKMRPDWALALADAEKQGSQAYPEFDVVMSSIPLQKDLIATF